MKKKSKPRNRHHDRVKIIRNFRGTEEYQAWRIAVLDRDRNTCQICFSKKWVEVHHIVMVSEDHERMLDVSNGITLCHHCHEKLHREIWYEQKSGVSRFSLDEGQS